MSTSSASFYSGKELIHAFRTQVLVQCDEAAAKALAKVAQCVLFKPGKRVVKQGDKTDDVYFVLQGSVHVLVNGTRVATRIAGQHVGEMASLLRTARTATIVTEEETIFAKVGGKDFSVVANRCPAVWRNLVAEIAARLHQRRHLIREPNTKPFIFIGSSTKTRDIAEKIRDGLKMLDVEIDIWSDSGVFLAGDTFIETLTDAAKRADFAVLIFGKDDVVVSKGKKQFAPRDNVVFEAGLFIGGIGRKRTFVVRQKNAGVKILSDLAGVTLLEYRKSKGEIDVGHACGQIRARIRDKWVR